MTVYGPFTRTIDTGTMYRWQRWYRRKPITRAPLQYSLDIQLPLPSNNGDFKTWNTQPLGGNADAWASAKAYERFKSKIGENASLALNLAERKQAISMIENRALQLIRFTNAVRRLDVSAAAKALGLSAHDPRLKRKKSKDPGPKQASNLWLEFHFGWSPLLNDIGNSISILQTPPPILVSRGRAKAFDSYTAGGNPSYLNDWTVMVQYQAEISVSSNSWWLANQLGFVNPAVILWELVPFSFVIDWFIPVGNFLGQSTDFVGLNLQNAFTTKYGIHNYRQTWLSGVRNYKKRIAVERSLGIIAPPLKAKKWVGFSPTRGATAVALLLQQLNRLR